MTDLPQTISEDLLHAYVDGVLDEPARRGVEAYLAQNTDAATRVQAWQTINEGLLRLGNTLGGGPGRKLEWRPVANAMARRRRVSWLRVTAVAASLLVGVLGGWWAHEWIDYETSHQISAGSPLFVRQAEVAYRLFANPQQGRPVELGAEQRDLLQRWLSGKAGLNVAMHVPQLEPLGWQLVGGRMLSDARGPAALYVYENGQKVRLSLYVVAMGEDVKLGGRWTRAEAIEICDWGLGRLHMALAGQLEREQMKALLGPINQQILAAAGDARPSARVPRLPDPQIAVSLNAHR